MNTRLVHLGWLLVASGLIFFTSLGQTTFWDEDEAYYGVTVHEMLARGDWIVPTYNQGIAVDKPPLFFWLAMATSTLVGEGELALRLVSVVAALATVLLVYDLGCRLYSPRAGFWGALALASNLLYVVSARAATMDALLVLLSSAAFYAFVRCNGLTPSALSLRSAVIVYSAMALATLTKGPIGFVLPTLGLMAWRLWQDAANSEPIAPKRGFAAALVRLGRSIAPGRIWRVGWQLRPITAVVVIVAITAPWFVAVGQATGGAWLAGFFGDHNLKRFLEPNYNHAGPVFYHVLTILVGMFPWSVFVPVAVVRLFQRTGRSDAWSTADRFVAAWAGAYLVFFSLASTKLPNYVLPACPAFALMIGALLDRWLSQPAESDLVWKRASMSGLAIGGAVTTVALTVAAHLLMNADLQIALLGTVPIVGGLVGFALVRRMRQAAGFATFAMTAVGFTTLAFTIVAGTVNRYHSGPQIARHWRENAPAGSQLASFRYLDPSEVYYSGQSIPVFQQPEQVRQFVAENPKGYLLVKNDEFDAVAELIPLEWQVLDRRQRFLRFDEELILFGPETELTTEARKTRR